MTVTVTSLSEALGAEITGVDLARPLAADDLAAVRAAWLAHEVVFFPDQELDADAQMAFARQFGNLQEIRSAPGRGFQGINFTHISNREVDGEASILPDGEMQFHFDQCYYERPAMATMLYAIEVPKAGGNTLFLSATKAYAALPDEDQAALADCGVHNVYDYETNPTINTGGQRDDAPAFVHPAVVRHPETGKPVLYVNRLMSEHLTGMEKDASDELLARLFDHAENPAFIYEHHWRPGDLAMWDNRASMHARTDFDPAEARIMRRVAVQGKRPRGIAQGIAKGPRGTAATSP